MGAADAGPGGGGRRAEALEASPRPVTSISDELGVDPGSELKRCTRTCWPRTWPARGVGLRPGRARRGGATDGAGGAPQARPDDIAADALAGAAAASRSPAMRASGGALPRDQSRTAGRARGQIAIGTLAESAERAGRAWDPEAAEGPGPAFRRPTQLPADIGDFTGRETHVEHCAGCLLAGNVAGSSGAVRSWW